MRVAEIGQLVFGRITALERGDQLVKHAGLADQVEADVGLRDVFFKNRPVAAPFGVALAEHQRVVGEVQEVINGGAHYMCPTASGIS